PGLAFVWRDRGLPSERVFGRERLDAVTRIRHHGQSRGSADIIQNTSGRKNDVRDILTKAFVRSVSHKDGRSRLAGTVCHCLSVSIAGSPSPSRLKSPRW